MCLTSIKRTYGEREKIDSTMKYVCDILLSLCTVRDVRTSEKYCLIERDVEVHPNMLGTFVNMHLIRLKKKKRRTVTRAYIRT